MITIARPDAHAHADGATGPVPALARPRLLVVDDEIQNLQTFRRVWRQQYEIETIDSPAAALRLLAERSYDVVLSDFGMPSMDGATFVEAGRRIQAVAFVLVTGYVDKPEVRELEERGVIFDVIAKPWRPAAMAEVIGRACAYTHALRSVDR